ncbi:MAG TPA: hypothetical protein VH482_12325 [Thermomicrobiales bacterium]
MGFAVAIAVVGALVVEWRPSAATNDPYTNVEARWTVENLDDQGAFVGLGVFVFRPDWDGPAQVFPGPLLLQVQDAQAPVRVRFGGAVEVERAGDGAPILTTDGAGAASATATAGAQELTLGPGDLVAIPPWTPFAVTTGAGETVRFLAVAILPDGPPSTPGVQQVEWRAWGEVAPVLGMPVEVTLADVELAGGEVYQFRRERGPALLSVEGSGDGVQPVALTVTKGRGTYLRMAEFPAWDLTATAAYDAVETPTILLRERAFDARSGAFLPAGTTARLHNRSLVDGTGVVMVTFDGPTIVTPLPSPTTKPFIRPTFSPTVKATVGITGTPTARPPRPPNPGG